ncbi:Dopey, N-terminal-domain-containing protein [Abortiporus biennis]|nr:Dopey, N-terminal-domain-containing protein [Abortiporus biennis]
MASIKTPTMGESSRASTPGLSGKKESVLSPSIYASDPKFKKYTQQVERCLSSFDSVHEWADFISFLKQLLKTFQSYMQFKEIPRKLVVSKRLAQCLNPALPTGVHQRALDVYTHILSVLGSEGLQRDLALWSSGLFPFFAYAATSVKPALLNIFDSYYLPLQFGLRPIMKSFILALLPGLEEETGEYFEKVLALLDKLSGTVSPSFFLQNVWLIMLTSPPARGTAINFLSRRLPQLNSNEDITAIVGRDIGLMIRAFAAALEDDDLLVRRGALDLLIQSLRVDSVAVKNAQTDDRTILMRAATSVVLRRDLSLNRRIYTWLLGTDENSQHQMDYLKANALELLRSTLKEEMFHPSAEYSQSRPFKIFISLLDKWEVGSLLTEVLVLDAFKSIKRTIDSGIDSGEDLAMTGSTLYEAVEPHALWKQMLKAVLADISNGSYENLVLVQETLSAYHAHDEEIETIHLPLVFDATLEALVCQIPAESISINGISSLRSLRLLREVLLRIPPSALKQRAHIGKDNQDGEDSQTAFVYTFYGLGPSPYPNGPSNDPSDPPFILFFRQLVTLSIRFAERVSRKSADVKDSREALIHTLDLLCMLSAKVDQIQGAIPNIHWNPLDWLSVLLRSVESEMAAFSTVDNVISTIIKLQQSVRLEPQFSLDQRHLMSSIINALFRYLRPQYVAYHMRAVNLLWTLEKASRRPHVETTIAQRLSAVSSEDQQEACEAFGVLWRLTDDTLLPGFRLKIPLMLVLDSLKNDDAHIRRVAETWMRCSLKSYLRVLDPLLYDLHEPAIRRISTWDELNGKRLQGFLYDCPFDQRYINHLLETLLSIVKFGGQGFSKIARSTPIGKSNASILLDRLQSAGNFSDSSYMDVVITMLLRFLQSEPKAGLAPTMGPFNVSLQSTAVDLLQALVVRGEVDVIGLQSTEAVIISKLYLSVHTRRLDLQNKLLHLLHSIISGFHAHVEAPASKINKESAERLTDGAKQDGSSSSSYNINPLLTQTLVDGISVSTNRSVLQHWLDFILMTVPQFPVMLRGIVVPLCDSLCQQLRFGLADILQVSDKQAVAGDAYAYTTDADFVMLLGALERLVSIDSQDDDDVAAPEKQEGGGLLGYVSTVFSSEPSSSTAEEQTVTRSDHHCLFDAIGVLYSVWSSLIPPQNPDEWTSHEESLSMIYTRSRTRCRRVLEHLFRTHSSEVLEGIIECWSRRSSKPDNLDDSAAFELVDLLTASAQNVVHMICESIAARTMGLAERSKKPLPNPNLTDTTLFDFLEQYSRRLEGPVAVQVWARYMQLVKDLVLYFKEFKPQAISALRCFTVLADKITQTTIIEDRRARKELQDAYSKLLDICLLAGRSPEANWLRRNQASLVLNGGKDSPIARSASDTKLDEKVNVSSPTVNEGGRSLLGMEVLDQLNIYITQDVIPNLRKFLADSDKILAACQSIVYNIVVPASKGRSRPLDMDDHVLSVLREMSKISTAMKAWRGPVVDVLNDNRCFNSTPDAGGKWRQMVKALFDTDKTALHELLGKITTAPSTNIFTNREYEMLLRSLNLRRLSWVVLTGDKNHFLTQLPTIQEKLVDTLRNVTAPIVQSEVYLCVRVLLCRLSPHNLSSFWPVILTEMYRMFEQIMSNIPSDGSEELSLILSASKLLDLLLVLQTEEFQIHQWIFITDTVDAVYRPDEWSPVALLDQLAEVVGDLPVGEADGKHALHGMPTAPSIDPPAARQPMLQGVRQIDSIRDLVPFFSHVSIATYESVYSCGGNVDWEAVERGLLEDMFDGR